MPRQLASAMESPERSVRSYPLDEWKTECVSGDPPERENTERYRLSRDVTPDQPRMLPRKRHNVAGSVRFQGFVSVAGRLRFALAAFLDRRDRPLCCVFLHRMMW